MKKTLILLGAGCVLVGVVGVVMLIIDGDFTLFAIVNGVIALVLLAVGGGSVVGADKDRPPGVARISASRPVGLTDPDELARRERAYQPDQAAVADDRMEASSSALLFLLVAIPPAIPAVIYLAQVL